jgi:CBS domain-containing protein
MPTVEQDIKSEAIELTDNAFEAFCEDIAAMFQVDISCEHKETIEKPAEKLNRKFKNLCAVNTVSSKGVMNGNFHLVLNQKALFVLSGIIVMLPEKRILENCKSGSEAIIEESSDAINEIGNLLIGSWNRIFQEELHGHEHFKQSNTFIGKPFNKSQETINLKPEETVTAVIYEINVESYPALTCAALFTEDIFESSSDSPAAEEKQTPEKEDSDKQKAEAQPQQETAEEGAKEESEQAPDKPQQAQPENAEAEQEKSAEAPKKADDNTENSVRICDITTSQVMQENAAFVQPEQTVQQAVEIMQQQNTPYLLVKSEQSETFEGIVSRSDITSAISPYLNPTFKNFKRPLDQATLKIKIKWIMTNPVETITADQPLSFAIRKMLTCGIRSLPVIDKDNKACGIITVFDILNAISPDKQGKTTVKVSPPVLSLN